MHLNPHVVDFDEFVHVSRTSRLSSRYGEELEVLLIMLAIVLSTASLHWSTVRAFLVNKVRV